MDAGARGDGDAGDGESPVDVTAEEQAWDEAMHQAMNLARARGSCRSGSRRRCETPMPAPSIGGPSCAAT